MYLLIPTAHLADVGDHGGDGLGGVANHAHNARIGEEVEERVQSKSEDWILGHKTERERRSRRRSNVHFLLFHRHLRTKESFLNTFSVVKKDVSTCFERKLIKVDESAQQVHGEGKEKQT